MSVWERQYRDAAAEITSPGALDDRILQQARQFKPIKQDNNRVLSGVASSCAALAIVILLIHPAQYLGALSPAGSAQKSPLNGWQDRRQGPVAATDRWFSLRSEVKAGNYLGLCQQWRRQQRGTAGDRLPRDLEKEAQDHCRLLPTR